MSLPEEVLNFDAQDEAQVIDVAGENRRIRKRDPINAIDRRAKFANFGFLEADPEDADLWENVSEESYEGDAGDEIRQEMGIYDMDVGLQEALFKLSSQGWRMFLQHPYIRQLFGRAEYGLFNFNNGAVHAQVTELWNLKWSGQLTIRVMRRPHKRVCYLCNKCRRVCYVANDKHGGEVYIGPDCYENRFVILMELVDVCYSAMEQLTTDIDVKVSRLRKSIEAVLMKIGEGNRRMVKQYE